MESGCYKKTVITFPPPMTLKVITRNMKACDFYEKQGWKKVSTHEEGSSPYHLYSYNGTNASHIEAVDLMGADIE